MSAATSGHAAGRAPCSAGARRDAVTSGRGAAALPVQLSAATHVHSRNNEILAVVTERDDSQRARSTQCRRYACLGRQLASTRDPTDEADLGVSDRDWWAVRRARRPGDRGFGRDRPAEERRGELAIDVCLEVFAAGIEWLPALSAAWHWPATSWVNSRTMQAGSSGLLFGHRFRC
jgi:hypothetical protein